MKNLLISTALSVVLGASAAFAADVDTIAILTPEQGSDYGWNQQGVDAAKAAAAAEGVEIIVAEGLGYGDVRAPMRELAADGADLMIAHASGYNTAGPEIAQETGVPVSIVDSPDALKEGLVADYTLSGHEGAYLAGRLAAKMTTTGTVGIVVSGEPPSWNSQSAGFAEGVKAENSEVKNPVFGDRPGSLFRCRRRQPCDHFGHRRGRRHHLRTGQRVELWHDPGGRVEQGH